MKAKVGNPIKSAIKRKSMSGCQIKFEVPHVLLQSLGIFGYLVPPPTVLFKTVA